MVQPTCVYVGQGGTCRDMLRSCPHLHAALAYGPGPIPAHAGSRWRQAQRRICRLTRPSTGSDRHQAPLQAGCSGFADPPHTAGYDGPRHFRMIPELG